MVLRLFCYVLIKQKMPGLLSIWPLLFILPCCTIRAQDFMADSTFYQKVLSNTRAQYLKNIGANAGIYQGTAYDHYWNKVMGNPFFLKEGLVPGKILYDGTLYENIPIAYDMLKEVLVTKSFSKSTDISLVGERVAYFSIDSHDFVRLVKDSTQSNLPNTGFYERLYLGDISVFEKREKKIKQSLKAEDNITRFIEYNYYYVQKDDKFYPVESESDLLNIFKDQRTEIRKFLNRREMNYKKDPSGVIVRTAAYYSNFKNRNAQ